jgi:hypothetical protein
MPPLSKITFSSMLFKRQRSDNRKWLSDIGTNLYVEALARTISYRKSSSHW